MTAITQKIRRFSGGISDQPDEQKIPGQVRDALNCVPDVVQGLTKRPGMNLIADANTTADGKWFFINKNNPVTKNERYVGQIDINTGKVKMWDLFTGKPQNVCYADNIDPLDIRSTPGGFQIPPGYTAQFSCEGEPGQDPSEDYFTLNTPSVDDLQVLTINDYTLVTNRKAVPSMNASETEFDPPQAVAEIRSLAGSQNYKLEFFEPTNNTSETSVKELSITGTGFSSLAPCSANVKQSFEDQTNGTGTGLGFRIETTSVISPTTISKPYYDGSPLIPNSLVFEPEYPGQQPIGTVQVKENRCNYTTKVVLTDGGTDWKVGDVVEVLLNGITYSIKVESVGKADTRRLIGTAEYTTPATNVQADAILDNLKTDVEGFGEGFTVERIGNSLYFTRPEPFSVTSATEILLRASSSTEQDEFKEDENGVKTYNYIVQVNDVAELPLQTKHNLVIEIVNSYSDADNYFVQFRGDNNIDGPGTWEEIGKPCIPHTLNGSTMPHAILRLSETVTDADGDTIVTFLVASFKYASREAGDDVTVPRPSFAPKSGGDFGRPINGMVFFRNRLGFLSDENIVLSTAGDFFNFFAETAITISPKDPIDLQVSTNYPAVLYQGIGINNGLVLFSSNAQFLLTTDNDALTPQTAKVNYISSYNCNKNSNPVSLGTTVGFVGDAGRYTRFFEMANIARDGEPDVVEASKVVDRLVPSALKYLAVSKENGFVSFGKSYSDEVWCFKYFNTGERRAQTAWFRWKFDGQLLAHDCIYDSYYAILSKDDRVFIVRGDLRALENTIVLVDDTGEEYRTYLDYAVSVETQNSGKKIILDADTIGFPVFEDKKDKVVSIVWDPVDEQGYIVPVKVDGTTLSIRTTVTNPRLFIGYTYEMVVDMPHFFVAKEGQGETISYDTANLNIQRVKLNLGRIGYYETTLKRLGRPDYTQVYEAKPMDKYEANELGYLPDYEQTTPVYQRNTGFRMVIHSEHPSPAVLYSATWEGDLTENYVRRL